MTIIKDSQYWQVYNQKRKDYLAQKKREQRAKLKMSTTSPLKVVDQNISVVDSPPVVDHSQVVDQKENGLSTTNKKLWNKVPNNFGKKLLWKDYYNCLKPYCIGCLEKRIARDEYAFCSTKKNPQPIYQEDNWGRKGKQIGSFNNIHACQVYHWTIYQGQNKIEAKTPPNY